MIHQTEQQIIKNPSPFLSNVNPTTKPALIAFDTQQQDVEFYSDHASQVYQQQGSMISTETQKRKVQMRNKVNEYIAYRHSIGMAHKDNSKKISYGVQDYEFQGDIVDQLGLIEGRQKQLGEMQQFILAFNKNPDQAIAQYIKKGIIHSDQPEVIAAYLITVQALDKQNLGKYFGENNQKILKILHAYCKQLKFEKVKFDQALRMLLRRFRLPGQAQQIQRIVWEFSLAFFEANEQQYDNSDQLFPLAYAIIMLSTDAHNPNQEVKMSKQSFIKNTKGACPSIQAQQLSGIYDRITSTKFVTSISDTQNMYMKLKDLQSGDFQSTLKLTKQLKKGDVFLKICRNTVKFVQRKLFLTDDESKILWISDPPSGEQQPRFIQIKDITGLTLGLGSEVMKKNKVPQQFDPMCFTIQTTHRTVDLKAKTNKERAKWLNYIRAILIKRRQAKLQELENNRKRIADRGIIQEIWNTQIFPHWDRHWDYKNKKPLVRNVLVRGIQALCCCWKRKPKTIDGLEDQASNHHGLDIKSSKLQTLWKLGLPANSRKVLWPLVIGNNLALNSTMIQEVKKRTKKDENIRKFIAFSQEAIEMAEFCRQFRPDIPAIRDLLLICSIFTKTIPKAQIFPNNSLSTNVSSLSSLLNLMHLYHFLAFYRGDKNQIDLRIQLFQFLLQKNALKVKKHFQGLKLETKMYFVSWFLSAFADCFNHYQAFLFRIWDNFLLEGQIYLFKVGITIIKYYEIQLKMCTFHEGLKTLRFPKNTSQILFFHILQNEINVKLQDFHSYIDMRKHAIIKTKVQAIPLQ